MATPARSHPLACANSKQAFSKVGACCSGARLRHVGHAVLPTDLSSVIDPRLRVPACGGSAAELQPVKDIDCSELHEELGHLVNHAARGPFVLRSHPGCILFPGWLSPEAQLQVAKDAFTVFPDSPAKTNHSARFGGLNGLWAAAEADKVLQQPDSSTDSTNSASWAWVHTSKEHLDKKGSPRPGVVTARRLLSQLRWSTLGPGYGAHTPPKRLLTPRHWYHVSARPLLAWAPTPGPVHERAVICVWVWRDAWSGFSLFCISTCVRTAAAMPPRTSRRRGACFLSTNVYHGARALHDGAGWP